MSDISIEYLRSILSYNPETGEVSWRAGAGRKKRPSDDPFGVNSKGYMRVAINRKYVLLHRVAWALHYGEWPEHQIDHENRIRSDNRIGNLRNANDKENNENRGLSKLNSSGHRGVTWDKTKNRWRVQVKSAGKNINGGRFIQLEDAAAAARLLRDQLYTHHNN